VITDYREPDRIRYGLAPVTTRFTDVWDAMAVTRQIIETKAYADTPAGSAG
jgi:kynureninase